MLEEIDNLKKNYEKGELSSLLTSFKINKLVIPVGTSIDEEEMMRQDFNPNPNPNPNPDNIISLPKVEQNYPIIPFDKAVELDN